MSRYRHNTLVIGLWLAGLALAVGLVIRAHYSADLSAFLPRAPLETQRLLIEQLNEGPASRLLLLAIEGADPTVRAALSHALAARLRQEPRFSFVGNGEIQAADTRFVFGHRYQLSPSITPGRFTAAGLRDAIEETLAQLSTPAGMLLEALVPQDPTGESAQILAGLQGDVQPPTTGGVWSSADGRRALLLARTRAAGSDTDAQEAAIDAVHRDFAALTHALPGGAGARLLMSGSAVFAVDARATIKREALRLSLLSTGLIVVLLLLVYRSVPMLLLGLVPVASGALAGIGAVSLGFGVVYGLTLGFGITLIGESVDYSIYLFIQSLQDPDAGAAAGAVPPPAGGRPRADGDGWIGTFWPTIRLGMLTSVCGFAALLPSSFPGLSQLGLYTISGLLAAALTTRFILPRLLPSRPGLRDPAALGAAVASALTGLRRYRALLWLLPVAAAAILYGHRHTLWNRDLASLSPASPAQMRLDGQLRADLGTADVRHLVIVSAADEQAALRGAEQADAVLEVLEQRAVIGGFESPARYLPSERTQRQRLEALPSAQVLALALRRATAGLPLAAARLQPFLRDVEQARTAPLLTPADLQGTSLAVGFDALMVRADGRWHALLPLRPPAATDVLDVQRVRQALAQAGVPDVTLLDLKTASDALYAGYMGETARLAGLGALAIAVLLLVALRSLPRMLRVIAPLALAVLCVGAGCIAAGERLGLLHVIGMLLIVAVGSNYALFFDRHAHTQAQPRTQQRLLASLLIANASTVAGFGVLAFSTVPVLQALGATVAPGAFLALWFAGLLAPRREPACA